MFGVNGRAGCKTVTLTSIRYGLAVGARKMIDHEYDHAVDSIQSNLYVQPGLFRSLTSIHIKNKNVFDLANILSAFVDISLTIINNSILVKSSILTVLIVPVNVLLSSLHDLKSVACIGWFVAKILMLLLGDLHVSKFRLNI